MKGRRIMVAYLTLDIDGFDMFTSQPLSKGDIILTEKEGITHIYQVTNNNSFYPNNTRKYYFGERDHDIVELKRVKYKDFPKDKDSTKPFEVTFVLEDGEKHTTNFDIRPSPNQMFYVNRKLVKVTKNIKKDKKKLVFSVEIVDTKPCELFYVSSNKRGWSVHSTFNKFAQANKL